MRKSVVKNNWKHKKIIDIAKVTDYIASGSFATLKKNVEYKYKPDYAILVRLRDYKSGWDGNYVYVPEHSYKFLSNSNLIPGDIVISNVGAYTGAVFTVPNLGKPMTLGPNAVVVKPYEDDKQYLYYYFRSYYGQGKIKSIISGSAQPKFNKTDFRQLEIPLPPLLTQHKIALILSVYDDLIELNERRIKILEEMVRLIYKEWFVKFRFPGYKKVKMVESELGKIPEGWEVRSILDIEDINLIKTRVRRYNGAKEYFATANVGGNNIIKDGEIVTYDERPSRAQMQPEENTIWFAKMRETFKVLCFTSVNKGKAENSILSTGFAGLKVVKDKFGFFYFTVCSERFHALKDQYCTGATQMSLTIEGLSLIKIVLPNRSLVREYSELIQPIIDQIIRFQQQSSNLRQTRDMLLPKLISGKIEME